MKQFIILALALSLSTSALFAQGKVEIKPGDTPATVLFRLVGQKVEVHLKNGEKFAGKLESATGGGVHISSIDGLEFFDAVIAAADITAVVVRAR